MLPLESQDLKRSLHRYLAPVVSPETLELEALYAEHTQDMHRRKSHRRAASDLTHPPSKAFSVIPGIASRADVPMISARRSTQGSACTSQRKVKAIFVL